MRLPLTLFLIGLAYLSTAQNIATDSKNKPILPFLAARKSRIEFGSRDFSLNFQGRITQFRLVTKRDSMLAVRQNVSKKAFRSFQVQLLNVADILTSTTIGTIRPGFKGTYGYQRTVDAIDPNYDGWTYSFGASVNLGMDNLKLYEPLEEKGSKVYPILGGADLNLTLFPSWSKRLLIALTGSYTYGYNDGELLNFKELGGAGLTTYGVAFDKFDGRFGTIQEGRNGSRASLGFPFLIGKHVAPVPYAVVVLADQKTPTWFSGVFLNVFSDAMDFRNLNASNTFGVGVDWNSAGGKWSAPVWFVRGNLNIGKSL